MKNEFNLPLLVDEIGIDLVSAFGKASRHGTAPDSIGDAKEQAVLKRLASLFPPAVRVGKGHVIDSKGNVSRQMDIVISEGEFCPEFRINDDPTCAYYPCQGVIAVGEIKSTLNRKELRNIWDKAESVRKLRRYTQENSIGGEDDRAFFRPYGSSSVTRGRPGQHHDQDGRGPDQIMVFGLSGQLGTSVDAIRDETRQLLTRHGPTNAPNAVGALGTGDLFVPMMKPNASGESETANSFLEAERSTHVGPNTAVFRWIVLKIWERYCFGFTAPVHEMAEYFQGPEGWGNLSDTELKNELL